jgi:phage terminase large subunit
VGAVQRVTIPYAPRRVFLPYHQRKERWAAIVAHRRCGKTVGALNDQIKRAVTLATPHGRFAYVAPYLSQAKEIAWDYLKRYAAPILADKNEAELWVELVNGARIRVHGADNPDRLRGGYLDGVILDEPADMRPGVWAEIIRPMLADRQGWATFIGTPKGKNEFWTICERAKTEPDWFFAVLKASETGLLAQTELDDARREMTPEQYAQEFECSFDAAITGAYYGAHIAQAEREGRVKPLTIDPAIPVHTAWDLGIGDSTAIWFFQIAPDGLRVVDFLEDHGKGLPHYAGELSARGYDYGIDFVPHDAKAREIGTGRTRVETLLALGRKPQVVASHTIDDGINALRQSFGRIWFDKARCSQGLEALRQYRTEYDEKTKSFRDKPRHDWTSHAADAARYMAMAWRELRPKPVEKPKPTEIIYEVKDGQLVSNMSIRELVELRMKRKNRDA